MREDELRCGEELRLSRRDQRLRPIEVRDQDGAAKAVGPVAADVMSTPPVTIPMHTTGRLRGIVKASPRDDEKIRRRLGRRSRAGRRKATVSSMKTRPVTAYWLLGMPVDEDRLQPARHAVLGCARAEGLTGERLSDLITAVKEGLTNALEHGGGQTWLSLWREDDRLVCEVQDEGPGMAPMDLDGKPLPAPTALGGRGIWLMRHLADEVEFVTDGAGTVARLSMRLP
ncbi:ATP-binding protein [Nonomuraea sp. NN258]|uniref:ATP-binding protein n=1 Tax=Nonomuraea antri TaxID=2730852 RepID=UPI001568C8BE|nr:ATP-binding protein [Nonomuraea antri]NRQ33695.1 ATP-binding protein [Nonomuraea antri]